MPTAPIRRRRWSVVPGRLPATARVRAPESVRVPGQVLVRDWGLAEGLVLAWGSAPAQGLVSERASGRELASGSTQAVELATVPVRVPASPVADFPQGPTLRVSCPHRHMPQAPRRRSPKPMSSLREFATEPHW